MKAQCEGCGADVPDDDLAQDRDGVTYNICANCQEDSGSLKSDPARKRK